MKKFTVWVVDGYTDGTYHIGIYEARGIEHAKKLALAQVAKDRNIDIRNQDTYLYLSVLGVAAGAVRILEWNDR